MKKSFKLLAFVLVCMMSAFVASCGSDGDGDNGNGNLNTPKYESSSALYNITDAGSAYSSIEFTASGNYIITMKNGASSAPRRIATVKDKRVSFLPQIVGVTRSSGTYNGIIYGTYTKNGDTYVLDGFGTITVNGGGSSAISLDITTTSGESITVGAQQEQQYSSSSMTNSLCRTWKLGKIRFYASAGGQTFDQTYNSWADYIKAMLIMEGLDENDSRFQEAYKEGMQNAPEQVIFTKSGTYVVFYANEQLAVSTWKWQDENKGVARYSWDYAHIDDPKYSGVIYISFQGSQMVITEPMYDSETYDGSEDITGSVYWYLTEVK